MPYPYDQVFAADPATPENVASNGVVTIFAPGDPNRAPLTIATLDGMPLQNPIRVNDAGFGPAFMHATLDQVAWEGGGFSGLLVSYQGMKDEAVAARQAAEEILLDVQAPTDEAVNRGIQRANIPGQVAQQVEGALASFDPKAVAVRVIHGTDPLYPRPHDGPVDWYGSVIPANRKGGDTYFMVSAEPAPWNPGLLTGLQGWYDPASAGIASGGTVQTLTDLSGRNRTLRSTEGIVRYQASGLGGSGGLAFTGSQMMATDSFAATGTGPITVFMVAKALNEVAGTTSNSGNFYDGHANGTMSLYRSGTTSIQGFGFRRSTTVGGVAGAVSDGEAHVFVITYDEAKSTIEIDGQPYLAGTTGNESISRLTFGARPDGTNKLNGMIGEFFWKVGTVGNTTKANAVSYLKARAGLI